MQVMHSVAVGAKVDLVGVERLVQRGGNVTDVGHKGSRVFLGHARNVVDMLLGGNDHTALVALLLKQDELAGGQVEHGDAKSIDERIIGPAHAIRAIGVLFHDGPFDLDKNECRYFQQVQSPCLHHPNTDRDNACVVDTKSVSYQLSPSYN